MTDETQTIIIDTEEGETIELTPTAIAPDANDAPWDPPITFTRSGDTDWLLLDFVRYANGGLSLPITLMVGGSLVSGILIGGSLWLEQFSELAFEAVRNTSTEIAEVVKGNITSYMEIYEREPNDSAPPANFIHLYNAKVYTGGKVVPTDGPGMLWRGRISEVAGFNLGTLSMS